MRGIEHIAFSWPGLLPASWAKPLIGAALLLPGCSPAAEPTNDGNETSAAQREAQPAGAVASPAAESADVAQQIAAKRRTLIAEAVEALRETNIALGLLAAGQTDEARAALARATGRLEIVLSADPELALAPVDVRATVHELVIAPSALETIRRRVEEAFDEGRLQDARRMLAGIASEQIISVTNIPLATYPLALKQAATLLHAGRIGEASATLESALSTLVVQETIIPLPLLRAELLINQAKPIVEKPQRSPAENNELQRLLAAAKQQIELARTLGYTTSSNNDALSKELANIERQVEGRGSRIGLFDRIKSLFVNARREATDPSLGTPK